MESKGEDYVPTIVPTLNPPSVDTQGNCPDDHGIAVQQHHRG